MKALRMLKKFLRWVWYGKSASSYIAFVLLAYVSLKYVAFPLFLGVFQLNDVVAVLSGSMHHEQGIINLTYNQWLDFYGYNKSDYMSWSFQDGMNVGDVVTVHPGNISVGDVVVYFHGRDMIIHRVINKTEMNGETYITTKGDANPDSMSFEVNIPLSQVVGRAGVKIPILGWPRVILYYITGF